MTPEHLVLRSRRVRRCVRQYERSHGRRYEHHTRHRHEYEPPTWVEAKFLREGDLVLFPRLKEERDIDYLSLTDYGINVLDSKFRCANQYGAYFTTNKPYHVMPQKLPLNGDFLWLLGYYLAEGVASRGGMIFNIGSHESRLTNEIVERLAKAFRIKPHVKDLGAKRRVAVHSRILARLFKAVCGGRAVEKHVPFEFLHLPNHKLVHLLRGLWAGDGTYVEYESACVARYNTVSEELAHQIYLILAKLGYIPGIKRQPIRPRRSGSSNGYVLSVSGQQLDRFCREIIGTKRRRRGNRTYNIGYVDENFIYLPIRKIERRPYTGYVYNLEVDDDSSYVSSFIVHNSAGVNLPARTVIVSSYERYEPGYGRYPISVMEYKQLAGRAGRPRYDRFGETILIARAADEQDYLMKSYVLGEPERLWSKLGIERILRPHVLATIAMGFAYTENGLQEFFSRTFYGYQYGPRPIRSKLGEILAYLAKEDMIAYEGDELRATEFGRRVSELYIDPISAVIIRDGLRRRASHLTELSFLHLISRTPDMAPRLYPRRKADAERLDLLAKEHREEFMCEVPGHHGEDSGISYEEFLAELKCAKVLMDWIDEASEDQILSSHGVEPGDLLRLTETADWLLYASHELAGLLGHKDLRRQLRELRARVIYGVRRDLLSLVKLEGIGRVRARILYNAGYKSLDDLKGATATELMDIPMIGPRLAKRIKEQAGGIIKAEEWELLKKAEKPAEEQRLLTEY